MVQNPYDLAKKGMETSKSAEQQKIEDSLTVKTPDYDFERQDKNRFSFADGV